MVKCTKRTKHKICSCQAVLRACVTWKIYWAHIPITYISFPFFDSTPHAFFPLCSECRIYISVEFFKEKHLGWIEDIDSEQCLISYLSRLSPGQLGKRKFRSMFQGGTRVGMEVKNIFILRSAIYTPFSRQSLPLI